MKLGSLNIILFISLFFFNFLHLNAQEKINLQDLQPTFEEESDNQDMDKDQEVSTLKSKGKTKSKTKQTIVKLKALDSVFDKTD